MENATIFLLPVVEHHEEWEDQVVLFFIICGTSFCGEVLKGHKAIMHQKIDLQYSLFSAAEHILVALVWSRSQKNIKQFIAFHIH